MSVEINPATPTSKEVVNVTSCNGVNLSASALYKVPFTDNCYMSFKIDPMSQADANKYCPNVQYLSNDPSPGAPANKPDGTLKSCMIGFFAVDKDTFDVKGPRWTGDMVQLFGHAFRVRGHIGTAYFGKENYGRTVVRGNSPSALQTASHHMALPEFNRNMVFTLTDSKGMMNFFVDDMLVDQKAFALPAGKALFAYYSPLEIPGGPQRITNFSVGSLTQAGGGDMPDCTTYCNPTKVYVASSARQLEQQASSATVQRASSARQLEQQASSATVQRASSARQLEQQASSATVQLASSATRQRASAAYELKMKYIDAPKVLAKALTSSLEQGQTLNKTAVTAVQPTVQGALSVIRDTQSGGRRRRGKKTRKATRRR
jgi:hypothetical protein